MSVILRTESMSQHFFSLLISKITDDNIKKGKWAIIALLIGIVVLVFTIRVIHKVILRATSSPSQSID